MTKLSAWWLLCCVVPIQNLFFYLLWGKLYMHLTQNLFCLPCLRNSQFPSTFHPQWSRQLWISHPHQQKIQSVLMPPSLQLCQFSQALLLCFLENAMAKLESTSFLHLPQNNLFSIFDRRKYGISRTFQHHIYVKLIFCFVEDLCTLLPKVESWYAWHWESKGSGKKIKEVLFYYC